LISSQSIANQIERCGVQDQAVPAVGKRSTNASVTVVGQLLSVIGASNGEAAIPPAGSRSDSE
jgi:hypothetical protein